MSTPSRPDQQYPPPGSPPPGAPGPDGPGSAHRPEQPPHPATDAAQATPPGHRAGFDERGKVKRGRISAAWVGLIAAALVLILLIIFIAQNLNKASIHFLGLSGRAPVGLMLLIAAVAGVLLVAVPGSIRILQLRRALKRNTPKDQRLPDGQR